MMIQGRTSSSRYNGVQVGRRDYGDPLPAVRLCTEGSTVIEDANLPPVLTIKLHSTGGTWGKRVFAVPVRVQPR